MWLEEDNGTEAQTVGNESDRIYRISQKCMFWEMWVNAVAMIFTQRKKGRHSTNTHKTCGFFVFNGSTQHELCNH